MIWILLGCVSPGDGRDDTGPATDDTGPTGTLRVATWNLYNVGSPGSDEFDATVAILDRLGADVVALQEVNDDDQSELAALADAAGYPHVVFAESSPFGEYNGGFLSRLEPLDHAVWTSAELSGDNRANDVTRQPLALSVDAPGGPVSVVTSHFKSGYDNEDEFRRSIDAIRIGQAAAQYGDRTLITGDFNAQLVDDGTESPSTWSSVPSGPPSSYELGSDLQALLDGDGISNVVYGHLSSHRVQDAARDSGREGTRPTDTNRDGRRIDHILVGPGLQDVSAQGAVYFSQEDEGGPTVPWIGEPAPRESSELASDHLPVVIELTWE